MVPRTETIVRNRNGRLIAPHFTVLSSLASRASVASRQPAARSRWQGDLREAFLSHCPGYPHPRSCSKPSAPIGPLRTPCIGNLTCRFAKTAHATAKTMALATLPSCAAAPSTWLAATRPKRHCLSNSNEQAGTMPFYAIFSRTYQHLRPKAIVQCRIKTQSVPCAEAHAALGVRLWPDPVVHG